MNWNAPNALRVRRLRLGAPKFLFHADRIDQIAAATAVACTDRSTSRWKQNQRAKTGRGSAPEKTSTSTNKPYELTSHLHPRPPYLTSYIGVRRLACIRGSGCSCDGENLDCLRIRNQSVANAKLAAKLPCVFRRRAGR